MSAKWYLNNSNGLIVNRVISSSVVKRYESSHKLISNGKKKQSMFRVFRKILKAETLPFTPSSI